MVVEPVRRRGFLEAWELRFYQETATPQGTRPVTSSTWMRLCFRPTSLCLGVSRQRSYPSMHRIGIIRLYTMYVTKNGLSGKTFSVEKWSVNSTSPKKELVLSGCISSSVKGVDRLPVDGFGVSLFDATTRRNEIPSERPRQNLPVITGRLNIRVGSILGARSFL